MEEHSKRPPINLSKVSEGEEEYKPGRGPLSYAEEKRPGRGNQRYKDDYRGNGSSGFKWLETGIAVLVSVIVSFLLLLNFSASSSKVEKLQTALDKANASIESVGKTATDASNKVNTVTNTMGDYARKSDLSNFIQRGDLAQYAQRSQVDSLQSDIEKRVNLGVTSAMASAGLATKDSLSSYAKDTDVQALAARVKVLENGGQATTTVATGTGGLSGTGTGVQAGIGPNPFTGASPTMSFSGIATNSNASQSFTIQVANYTGKQVNNIQLALAFQVTDGNNVVVSAVPASTVLSLTSTNLSIMWTAQATGVPYILGFTNGGGSANSFFGTLGSLSQGPGTASYGQTLTVGWTGGAGTTSPTLIFWPMVKVVGYQ